MSEGRTLVAGVDMPASSELIGLAAHIDAAESALDDYLAFRDEKTARDLKAHVFGALANARRLPGLHHYGVVWEMAARVENLLDRIDREAAWTDSDRAALWGGGFSASLASAYVGLYGIDNVNKGLPIGYVAGFTAFTAIILVGGLLVKRFKQRDSRLIRIRERLAQLADRLDDFLIGI